MSFESLSIRKVYDSDQDNILEDFYIPVLSKSVRYHRLAGFFSSRVLRTVARGLAEFILGGGTIQLLTSVVLEKEDVEIMKNATDSNTEVIERAMHRGIEDLEEGIASNHLGALAWMVKNGRLEIRVAVKLDSKGAPLDMHTATERGLFHQKVGVLQDKDGLMLSFSGSINESHSGWTGNIEQFKVFRSWIDEEREFFQGDLQQFLRHWEGKTQKTRVFSLPDAIRDRIVRFAPEQLDESSLRIETEALIRESKPAISLWPHQEQAKKIWIDSDFKGILEMATGTGKTRAAIACLSHVLKENTALLTVISSPYRHISEQWDREIEKLQLDTRRLYCDSNNPDWRNCLSDSISHLNRGIENSLTLLTTHATLSSDSFIDIVDKCKTKCFLICDEVHGVGAPIRRKGLLNSYCMRLGLSATPERYFDDEGTAQLMEFFGGIVFRFTLDDALNSTNPLTGETYLTPYEYNTRFVSLTPEELDRYHELSERYARRWFAAQDDKEKADLLEKILVQRWKIVYDAERKYDALKEILNSMKEKRHTLIYCSSGRQVRRVQKILSSMSVRNHTFTHRERSKPECRFGNQSEREHILNMFADADIEVLVSMRCLDEGVDIPQIENAIIMASTGNPRQFIQRRGRILRRYPGKTVARVYDIVVSPSPYKDSPDLRAAEQQIFRRELERYREFCHSSAKPLACWSLLQDLLTDSKGGA